MRGLSTLSIGAGLAIVGASALGMPSGAQGQSEPIAIKPLTQRHAFTDDVTAHVTLKREGLPDVVVELDDASNIVVVEATVQPRAMFPWHTHPALVLVAVREGELVYVQAEDCAERSYPAGTAFVDPGFESVHMAFNPSEEDETHFIAVFLGAPDEGGLSLAVDATEGAALDNSCGIDR